MNLYLIDKIWHLQNKKLTKQIKRRRKNLC